MDDQPKNGCGCFVKGCLTVVVLGALLVLGAGFASWHYYNKAVATFTSTQPVNLSGPPPTEAEYAAADSAFNQVRDALSNNRETTVEFTGRDLNALVARHPLFAEFRGKMRVQIEQSVVSLEMTAPLDSSRLPKLRGRWLNATCRFGFDYENSQFTFTPHSAEAGGHVIPAVVLSQSFASSFNSSFSKSFFETANKNRQAATAWKRIRRMWVEGDKLLVTTRADFAPP
jgi:hypothetical protein